MLSDSKVPSWDTLVSSTWLYSYFVLLSALIFILPYSLSFHYFKHCWGNNDDKDIPAVWTLTWVDVFLRASLVAQLVKKSACNAGDLGMIPGSGRPPGEGIGYPLQYSWASLVAQMVKNPPAMQIWSLGGEDPLEAGMETHSNILACRIPMDRRAWRALHLPKLVSGEERGDMKCQREPNHFCVSGVIFSEFRRTQQSKKKKWQKANSLKRRILPDFNLLRQSVPFFVHYSHWNGT